MTGENKKSNAPQWTQQQHSAIYDEGGTLLVSAAAGSGKTAVLVERAVNLMLKQQDPVPADKLLIVTFTRAAAQELRGRINVRLAEKALEQPRNSHIRRQKMLLGRANICTIHAFCMQLLQRFFAQLSIAPNFGIADEAQIYELKNTAMQITLEKMYEDEHFCALSSMYGRAKNDNSISAAVAGLYDFAKSTVNPNKTLADIVNMYKDEQPFENTGWGSVLIRKALSAAQNALKLTKAARLIVSEEPLLANYDIALSEDESFYSALCELLRQNRWDDALVYTSEFKNPSFKAVKGYTGEKADTVKALRKSAKKITDELKLSVFICTKNEFVIDKETALPMLIALTSAVKTFEQTFFSLKMAENVLEYSDFEHLAIKLMCDEAGEKTPIGRSIAAGFDAVMVDEYQDTNEIQSKIYSLLANEDESNLFFVGDVKQSIYRFRLANPEIFIKKRNEFAPYDGGKSHPATIILGHNFRSAQNIVDQINDVFTCLMSDKIGDVNYTSAEELKAGAQYNYNGTAMSIKFVDTGEEEVQNTDAGVVAATIAHMVNNKFLVREKNSTRACNYGDFCILLRTRSNFKNYEAALTKSKIPFYADTAESFLTSKEITPIISLLKVIDNPGRDIEMAAALMSPIYGFTADDLLEIRSENKNGRLYSALLNSKMQKAVIFCKELQFYRTLAANVPASELCAQIFSKSHYFTAVGAMENGAEKRDNLRLFTQFVKGCMSGGLSALLRRIDSAILTGGAQAGAANAVKGVVSIMTVHRSKGLEFPVCILADSEHRFNMRDISSPFLFHPKFGAGLKLRQKNSGGLYQSAQHAAIASVQKGEALSEEMRVLYVALTRAKDKLIVTMPMKDPIKTLTNLTVELLGTGGASDFILSRQNSFGAWLSIFALLHPNCDDLRKFTGGALLPLIDVRGKLDADIVPADVLQEDNAPTQFVHTALPDEKLLNSLLNIFDAYKMRDYTMAKLPVKMSVSSLSHKGQEQTLSRPAFLYSGGLTAAEKGTAQHTFLQFANFENAKQNLEKEIERLVEQDFLDAQLANKLPRDAITAFLNADILRRISMADVVKREYDFLTTVPASLAFDELKKEHENENIYVQGIADIVLINGDTCEIIDYKTDKNKTKEDFVNTYSQQLKLYKLAIEKRLNLSVTACTIYSFANRQEISVPIYTNPE